MPLPVSPPYSQIYFDSNGLIEAKWPSLSQKMLTAFSLSEFFSASCILLAVVEKELAAHWMRDFLKTRKEAAGKLENLRGLGGQVGLDIPANLPEASEAWKMYLNTVDQLVEAHKVVRASPPLRRTEEFFEMAINHTSPFKEKGKNFQDAVVCAAAIDDLASHRGESGVLVSRDDIFDQETLDALARPLGVSLRLFKTVDDLVQDLRTFVTKSMMHEWAAEEKLALEAVRASMSKVEAFIVEHLEFPQGPGPLGLAEKIVSVSRIDLQEVSSVETPAPWEITKGEAVTLTATTKLRVFATVERYQAPVPARRGLRVGKAPEPETWRPFWTEQREEILDRTVAVEIRAVREAQAYVDLEPSTVRLAAAGFAGIGSTLRAAAPS